MRALLAFLLMTGAAMADQPCVPDFDRVTKALHDQFGEEPQIIGLMNNGRPIFIFANPKTGTWTVIFQSANGQFCSPASGTDYKTAPVGAPT